MGSNVSRTRKWLLAGFAAALISLALGGCSISYFGYWPGRPPGSQSNPINWASSPGGLNNAQRSKEGGTNVFALGVYPPSSTKPGGATVTCDQINNHLTGTTGNQLDSIVTAGGPVLVRLTPCSEPAMADDTWKSWVRNTLLTIQSRVPIVGVQIGNEPNLDLKKTYDENPAHGNWTPVQYAHFFSDTASFIKTDSQLASLFTGVPMITAGLAPNHNGQYDAEAQCSGTDPYYTCPRTYINTVLNKIANNSWGWSPDMVAIHLYSGRYSATSDDDIAAAEDRMMDQYHDFISASAIGSRPIWVTEAGSFTSAATQPEPNPAPIFQDQADIDVSTLVSLDGDDRPPVGVIGFTLNDVGYDLVPPENLTLSRHGVLDTSNQTKNSGAYCGLAALGSKYPLGCDG